jgi:hypothetical protein
VAVAGAVVRYADRLHAAVPDEHHVDSPLGAWLLLALLAPVAENDARLRLEDVLGTDAAGARSAADALLADPHPAVRSALALWTAPGVDRPAYETWAGRLPDALTRAPLPGQAGLDAWARDKTDGIIDRFPLTLEPDTVSVLASALAARVRWAVPLRVVPAAALGGQWPASSSARSPPIPLT